jgi:hypothetical protein
MNLLVSSVNIEAAVRLFEFNVHGVQQLRFGVKPIIQLVAEPAALTFKYFKYPMGD